MAQTAPAGKVVALEGTATVTRVAFPDPRPLAFKDDIFVRDRVATGDQSITRLLLGGKASVTVREHSVLYITEVPGTSTVNLSYGRISVAVSKDRMKPGETVEIRTPNSVAAIRGTVVVAEVEPGYDGKSTITVLRGLIDVVKIDNATGRIDGSAVPVAALQSVTVIGAAAVPPAAPIKPDTAQQLTNDFQVIPKTAPKASMAPVIESQLDQAKVEAAKIARVLTSAPTPKDKTKDKGKHRATDNSKDKTKDSAKVNAQDTTTSHAKDNSKHALPHVNARGLSNTDGANDGGDPGAWTPAGPSNGGGNGGAKGAGDNGGGSNSGGNTAGAGSSGGGAALVNAIVGGSDGGGTGVTGGGSSGGGAAGGSSGAGGNVAPPKASATVPALAVGNGHHGHNVKLK